MASRRLVRSTVACVKRCERTKCAALVEPATRRGRKPKNMKKGEYGAKC